MFVNAFSLCDTLALILDFVDDDKSKSNECYVTYLTLTFYEKMNSVSGKPPRAVSSKIRGNSRAATPKLLITILSLNFVSASYHTVHWTYKNLSPR